MALEIGTRVEFTAANRLAYDSSPNKYGCLEGEPRAIHIGELGVVEALASGRMLVVMERGGRTWADKGHVSKVAPFQFSRDGYTEDPQYIHSIYDAE